MNGEERAIPTEQKSIRCGDAGTFATRELAVGDRTRVSLPFSVLAERPHATYRYFRKPLCWVKFGEPVWIRKVRVSFRRGAEQ